MIQPDGLKSDAPLEWTPGTGTEVWSLLSAAVRGDVGSATALLDTNEDLVRSQHDGRTALYLAVRENHLDLARLLIDRGANPFYGGMDEPLADIARYRGFPEMAAMLDQRVAQVIGHLVTDDVVGRAIRAQDLETVRELLDSSPELLSSIGDHGNQPIHWAVMTRQLNVVDELLSRGADINARRFDGARPIQLCNGDYHYRGWQHVPKGTTTTSRQVLDHLLDRGAERPMTIAALMGDRDGVKMMLDRDPSLANRNDDYVTYYLGSGSPLRNAASQGHLDVVKVLLEHGADPNLDEPGIAPRGAALYAAVSRGHIDVARLLLEHGAFPNPPMESSADALTMAQGNPALRDLLCSYGAHRSIDILGYYGDVQTAAAVFAVDPTRADDPVALSNAAGEGHRPFIELLLHHAPSLVGRVSCGAANRELTEWLFTRGMTASVPDWMGVTPLHRFARAGDIDNAAAFLDHGAQLDVCDDDLQSTPLGWAARSGRKDMVAFLLDRGANRQIPGQPAWASPLAWATRNGHGDVVALLGT